MPPDLVERTIPSATESVGISSKSKSRVGHSVSVQRVHSTVDNDVAFLGQDMGSNI